MKLDKRHTSNYLVLLISIFIVLLWIGIYSKNIHQIRSEIETTFQSRNELVKKLVDLHQDQVTVMKNLFVEHYKMAIALHDQSLKLQNHPELNIWELTSDNASVTGNSPFPLTKELLHEINAASAIAAQSLSALAPGSDVIWAYYQSANHFIYLSPKTPIQQFHFTPKLYQEGYWLQANPKANPQKRMIISGPYQDLAGKGWIITFAQPVYIEKRFFGVVALDIHIDTLHKLTNIGSATGETMMISENDHLIAKQNQFRPGLHVKPPLSDKLIDWKEDTSSDLWLSSPVVKDELWLLHHVTKKQIYGEAALRSLPSWFILLMFSLLGIVALKLEKANLEITRLMHMDPLTKALNRRGFYEKSRPSLLWQSEKI